MARTQFKFTAIMGKNTPGEVVLAAGSAESSAERISVNIDADKMTRGEAIAMLKQIEGEILAANWPAL